MEITGSFNGKSVIYSDIDAYEFAVHNDIVFAIGAKKISVHKIENNELQLIDEIEFDDYLGFNCLKVTKDKLFFINNNNKKIISFDYKLDGENLLIGEQEEVMSADWFYCFDIIDDIFVCCYMKNKQNYVYVKNEKTGVIYSRSGYYTWCNISFGDESYQINLFNKNDEFIELNRKPIITMTQLNFLPSGKIASMFEDYYCEHDVIFENQNDYFKRTYSISSSKDVINMKSGNNEFNVEEYGEFAYDSATRKLYAFVCDDENIWAILS